MFKLGDRVKASCKVGYRRKAMAEDYMRRCGGDKITSIEVVPKHGSFIRLNGVVSGYNSECFELVNPVLENK